MSALGPDRVKTQSVMGATHFLMKTLPKAATEMALHVLACNLTRAMNINHFLATVRACRFLKELSTALLTTSPNVLPPDHKHGG
jgi:hypothetical protein